VRKIFVKKDLPYNYTKKRSSWGAFTSLFIKQKQVKSRKLGRKKIR